MQAILTEPRCQFLLENIYIVDQWLSNNHPKLFKSLKLFYFKFITLPKALHLPWVLDFPIVSKFRHQINLHTFIENLFILMIRHWTKNVTKILSSQILFSLVLLRIIFTLKKHKFYHWNFLQLCRFYSFLVFSFNG